MENDQKTKAELGIELLDTFFEYTNQNTAGMRATIQEVLTETMYSLGETHESTGSYIDPVYLIKLSHLFEQLNNTCDILDKYQKIFDHERLN